MTLCSLTRSLQPSCPIRAGGLYQVFPPGVISPLDSSFSFLAVILPVLVSLFHFVQLPFSERRGKANLSAGSSSEFLLSGMWCFVNELNEGVCEQGAEMIELPN